MLNVRSIQLPFFFSLVLYLGSWASVLASPDTIVELPLDEGSGVVAGDVSGNGNDGALVNGPVFEVGTPDGSAFALRFDGVDDYIDLGTVDVAGTGLTLAAWFNADSYPGTARDPRLISKATGTSGNDHVFMLSTIRSGAATRLRARVRIAGVTRTLIASSGDLATGVWQHGALTHDGVTLRLYLNGVEVGSTALAGTVDVAPTVPVTVGAQPPGAGGRFFNGLIDHVRIEQRAFSVVEIGALLDANSVPTAVNESYMITEDITLAVSALNGVLVNDSDGDSDPLQAVLESDVVNGTLVLNADGSFDYTPTADFFGTDGFTYRANDGAANSNVASVTLTVNPVNDTPVGLGETYQTEPNTTLVVDVANGVLANDMDPDPDVLQTILESDVSSGILTLNVNGSFNYTPDTGFVGTDSFTYRVSDGVLNSSVVVVTMTVVVPPSTLGDAYTQNEDTPLVVLAAFGVLANDVDTNSPDDLTASLVTGPTNGVLTGLAADGGFTYTPDPQFHGTDSFVYRATDGVNGTSALGTVMLTVNAINDAPVVVDASYTTPVNSVLVVDSVNGVLANAVDVEGDILQSVVVNTTLNGTLNLNTDGSFDYTPNPGYGGIDSFTYHANDGALNSNVATVTLTIDNSNDPPSIQTGKLGFNKQTIDTTVEQTHYTAGADLDGDSDIDLIATNFIGDAVYWYRNDGTGSFTRQVIDNNLDGAYPGHLGDVDSDGDIDVLAGGYLGDTLAWYDNDGAGNFLKRVVDSAADGIHSMESVDLNEDGFTDLLTTNQDAGTVVWYKNDGANAFTPYLIDNTATGAKHASFADLDGDGDVDVVAVSFFANEVAWYENDGSENFTKRTVDSNSQGAYFVVTENLDGDAHVDLLVASKNNNTIAWYRNSGAGTFTRLIIDSGALGARSVFTADVDGDGDMDALATSVDDDTLAWFENDGDGGFTKRIVDQAGAGVYGVFAIDMNADGNTDVLSASRDDNSVSVHLQVREHNEIVSVGGTLIIGSSELLTTDLDDAPSELTYTLTSEPSFGELQLDGAKLLVDATFTQADVDLSRLAYVHYGTNTPADIFTFTVADGGENGAKPVGGTFVISSVDPADFLVQLSLNEGSGTVAFDNSGTGNDGILVNGPTFAANTPDGSEYAVRLDGNNDYIDLGTLDLAGNGLTLAVWFNADSFPGSARDPRLISKAMGAAANDHVFMLSTIKSGTTTRLRGRVRVGGETITLIGASGDLATGVWQHGALTHDGQILRLYLNGVEVGSTPLVGVVDLDPSVTVTVGSQPPGAGGRWFDGLIDDVRLLQRGLVEQEIVDIVVGGPGS